MGTALHSYVNATSCVCSCKEEHTKGNTHAEFTTPVEQVHQPGQADQSTTPNSRDQLRLLFQRQNTPREHTRRVYYTRAGPSTRQLAVPNSRDQLRRVLHPSSRAINPVKAFNQPSRIHETSCACSWQMRNTRRGMHSERSTHRGDYTSRGMYTDRSTHRGLHAEDGRCTVHALTRLLANVAIGLAGMYKYVHVQ